MIDVATADQLGGDPATWAQQWCKVARQIQADGGDPIDEVLMTNWFANAIGQGRFIEADVASVAMEAAGEVDDQQIAKRFEPSRG